MAPGLAASALEEVSQRGLKNPLGRARLALHRLVDLHALAFDLEQQFVTGGHGDLLRHVRNSGLRQRRYGKEDRANSRQENTKTPRHGKSPYVGVIGQLPPNARAHLRDVRSVRCSTMLENNESWDKGFAKSDRLRDRFPHITQSPRRDIPRPGPFGLSATSKVECE